MNFTNSGAVDVGIVVRDGAAALAFYRDILGLEHEGDMPMKGAVMHRVRVGASLLKLIAVENAPASPPAGGITDGLGIRYVTLHVEDVAAAVATCEAAGVPIVVSTRELRPGVTMALVNDPDGNIVEFLHVASA